MNQLIIQAIGGLKLLELRYHGWSRLVEPHAYGRDKSGDEVLRCYQVSGGSDSGERFGWKLLKLKEVSSLAICDTCFTPRPDYKRNDKSMVAVFEQI